MRLFLLQSNFGSPSGIIDIIKISEILESIAMIKSAGAAAWTPSDQTALNTWLNTMLMWLQNSPQGIAARGQGIVSFIYQGIGSKMSVPRNTIVLR